MHRRRTPWKVPSALAVAVLIGGLTMSAGTSAGGEDLSTQVRKDLADVRAATARFHDVDAAEEAGYELGYLKGDGTRIITTCVTHPSQGAMGFHYFNKPLIDDNVVDVLAPEGLVYAPKANGRLKLVAVEYVVPGENSNPAGPATAPPLFERPMTILVPAVGFHTLHAWIWDHNPSGMFAHWNPDVSCST